MPNVRVHGISLDLLREFKKKGHEIFIVCSCDGKKHIETQYSDEYGFHILRVKIGKNKKAGVIEKGITQLFLPRNYISAISKKLSNVRFDLILYPTPPVTHASTVKYLKCRDGAMSYLLLKDIFPQNAVDIGLMSKSGVKGIIYRYFRAQEKKLYVLSDYIGCMSQANIDYILEHNSEIDEKKVEVCPNSVEPRDMSLNGDEKKIMRKKYDIPQDKTVFVYGGNLGKPQGIPFLIECLKSQTDNENIFFLIVGNGTEYEKIEEYVNSLKQKNIRLMSRLPEEDYDRMVGSCDVGLIFLDHRFTIPNFPSRLLTYMQAKLPVLAVTDPNTDIGKIIVDGGFGWWCESNDVNAFCEKINQILNCNVVLFGENAWKYLNQHYCSRIAYDVIEKHIVAWRRKRGTKVK